MTRRRLAAIAVAATLWAPLAACDDAGISIPFPQLDVHMLKDSDKT